MQISKQNESGNYRSYTILQVRFSCQNNEVKDVIRFLLKQACVAETRFPERRLLTAAFLQPGLTYAVIIFTARLGLGQSYVLANLVDKKKDRERHNTT